MENKLIAVVYSLKNEVADLVREMKFQPLEGNDKSLGIYESKIFKNTILVEGGIGHTRAEVATKNLIARFKPNAIISAGFAAGLRASLKTADLVVCKKMLNASDLSTLPRQVDVIESNDPLLESVGQVLEQSQTKHITGNSLSCAELVSDASMKRKLGEAHQAEIAEMESYWVCKVATEAGIPAAAIRVVLDTSSEDLPPFVALSIESNGKGIGLMAMKYLAVNPLRIRTLMKLSGQAKKSQAALSRALISVLNGFQTGEGITERQ